MRKIARNNPKSVCLETCSLCNGACLFCPYKSVHAEPPIYLDEKYILSVIDEASGMDVERFSLFNNNEPLLDERIYDYIKYVRKKMPSVRTTLSSNGKIITTDNLKRAIESGIDNFYISLPTLDTEMSKKLMGIDAEKVVETVLSLPKKLYKNVRFAVPITRFFSKEEYARRFDHLGIRYITWEMEANSRWDEFAEICKLAEIRYEFGCDRPMDQAIISANGDVLLCCRDWNHEAVVGNVKEESLREIWIGERLRRYQEIIGQENYDMIELCSSCSRVCDLEKKSV